MHTCMYMLVVANKYIQSGMLSTVSTADSGPEIFFPCSRRAPEIYEEQPYSFKSDVWALGCVLYEMLMGKPAFAADNLSRVVIRVGAAVEVVLALWSPYFSQLTSDILPKSCMLCICGLTNGWSSLATPVN